MLLNDEFKDEDLLSKKRASEKLDIVAKVLGPEKSRRILVPWLSGTYNAYAYIRKWSD